MPGREGQYLAYTLEYRDHILRCCHFSVVLCLTTIAMGYSQTVVPQEFVENYI